MTGTMNGSKCPRECRVRLGHLEKFEAKADITHNQLFEELKMKVSQRMFFWLLGISVTVLIALFSAIYLQGSATLSQLTDVKVAQAKIQEGVKNNSQNTETVMGMVRDLQKDVDVRGH